MSRGAKPPGGTRRLKKMSKRLQRVHKASTGPQGFNGSTRLQRVHKLQGERNPSLRPSNSSGSATAGTIGCPIGCPIGYPSGVQGVPRVSIGYPSGIHRESSNLQRVQQDQTRTKKVKKVKHKLSKNGQTRCGDSPARADYTS